MAVIDNPLGLFFLPRQTPTKPTSLRLLAASHLKFRFSAEDLQIAEVEKNPEKHPMRKEGERKGGREEGNLICLLWFLHL